MNGSGFAQALGVVLAMTSLVGCSGGSGSSAGGGGTSSNAGGGGGGSVDAGMTSVAGGGGSSSTAGGGSSSTAGGGSSSTAGGGADADAGMSSTAGDGGMPVDACEGANGGCDPLVSCSDVDGVAVCGACPSGYTGDGESGCVDLDECATANGGCDALTACTNTDGGRTCGACPSGYTGDGESGCVDIDECATANGGCDALTACTNTDGGRTCGACPSGYSGDGDSGCVDIDECVEGTDSCGANETCGNTPGGFDCTCAPGFQDNDTDGTCEIACASALPANCTEIASLIHGGSGLYLIDPDGAGGNDPYEVHCLLDSVGGTVPAGFTVVFDQHVDDGFEPNGTDWASQRVAFPSSRHYSIMDRLGEFANATGAAYELLLEWPDIASYAYWTQEADPSSVPDVGRGAVTVLELEPAGIRGDSGAFGGLAQSHRPDTYLDIDEGNSYWGQVGAAAPFGGGLPAYRDENGAGTVAQQVRVSVRSSRSNGIAGQLCRTELSCNDAAGPAVCEATLPLEGLLAHYDAQDASSVSTIFGSAVTGWADRSGNGHDLAFANMAPSYSGSIHGRPAIRFPDETGLSASGIPLNAEVTVFAVVQHGDPEQWGALAHHGLRDSDWSLEQSGLDPSSVMHFQSDNDLTGAELSFANGEDYIVGGVVSGDLRMFVQDDGTTRARAFGEGVTITPRGAMLFVGRSDAGETYRGSIGELLYYGRALTEGEREAVLRYLAQRWGFSE